MTILVVALLTGLLGISVLTFTLSDKKSVSIYEYNSVILLERVVSTIPTEMGLWVQWQDNGYGVISVPILTKDVLTSWAIGCDMRTGVLEIKPNNLPQELNIPNEHPAIEQLAKTIAVIALENAKSEYAKPFKTAADALLSHEQLTYANRLLTSYGFGKVNEDLSLMPGDNKNSGITMLGNAFFSTALSKNRILSPLAKNQN